MTRKLCNTHKSSEVKQAVDHGLMLEKVRMIFEFNQEASLKPYIDMNTELRAKAKK